MILAYLGKKKSYDREMFTNVMRYTSSFICAAATN